MRIEKLDAEAALERGLRLPYALVRSLSTVTLGKTPRAVEIEELLEARFFSENEEIRLFRKNGGLNAVLLREEPADSVLEDTFRIENGALGRSVTVRHLLDFDEDGQAYIKTTRLAGWEGGAANA